MRLATEHNHPAAERTHIMDRIPAIVTTGFGSSRRLSSGAYCQSLYCYSGDGIDRDPIIVPEGLWNRGTEETMRLWFGSCRVARGVYVTDHGDTSTRDCWTSQAQKTGRAY